MGLSCLVQLLTWLTYWTTVIFGTLKDDSLQINSFALDNCFSYRNVFQNGVNALSTMVLKNPVFGFFLFLFLFLFCFVLFCFALLCFFCCFLFCFCFCFVLFCFVLFLSKSSKFCVVWTIRCCSNYTSMWYKYFVRNLWRDLRLPMTVLATVARKRFNGKFTAKIDFPIGHFILPLLMLTLKISPYLLW